jgi:hypothetical protein
MSEVFFVSVKRLVRICACRDRVSDPRVAECTHRSAEKREMCAWDDQGAGSGFMPIRMDNPGVDGSCACDLVVLSAIRAFGGCLGTRRR